MAGEYKYKYKPILLALLVVATYRRDFYVPDPDGRYEGNLTPSHIRISCAARSPELLLSTLVRVVLELLSPAKHEA